MAHAWKACWVNALGGSNPPSSAPQQALDLRKQVRGLFRPGAWSHATAPSAPCSRQRPRKDAHAAPLVLSSAASSAPASRRTATVSSTCLEERPPRVSWHQVVG